MKKRKHKKHKIHMSGITASLEENDAKAWVRRYNSPPPVSITISPRIWMKA